MLTIAIACLVAAPWSSGEPFADLGFEAALERTKASGKLLLVDFTAIWCQPCKRMDRDTWGDAGVRAWLAEHALAIQVDVDREKELARRLGIEAMPTVVAFREGDEFDRITGYRDAQGFLAWTRDVLAGKRSSDALMERARALAGSDDVRARLDLARDLLRAKHYDAALEHYLWLWPATRESAALGGVRASFMLSEMAELAQKHEPARKAFSEILEALQARVDAAEVPAFQDWQEWTGMCGYFGESARIIAWYEMRRDAEGRLFGGEPADHVQSLIKEEISDLLIAKDRPLDAVRLVTDGRVRAQGFVDQYRTVVDANERFPVDEDGQMIAWQREKLRADLSRLYAALLLAGRIDEAVGVADLLLRTLDDPQSRLALVRAGIDIVKRREPSFSAWLDEAEAGGASVRMVRRKLEKLPEAGAEVGSEKPGG